MGATLASSSVLAQARLELVSGNFADEIARDAHRETDASVGVTVNGISAH